MHDKVNSYREDTRRGMKMGLDAWSYFCIRPFLRDRPDSVTGGYKVKKKINMQENSRAVELR